jgi:hypothetical protein
VRILARARTFEGLFEWFDTMLRDEGWLAMGGQIVDATEIAARRPRPTKAEKETIRGGGTPGPWKKARTAQIDRDGPLDPQAGPQARRAARPDRAPGGCSATRTMSPSTANMASSGATS